jgi:hypothetical protein
MSKIVVVSDVPSEDKIIHEIQVGTVVLIGLNNKLNSLDRKINNAKFDYQKDFYCMQLSNTHTIWLSAAKSLLKSVDQYQGLEREKNLPVNLSFHKLGVYLRSEIKKIDEMLK